tara:strand:+ start:1205 stop:2008 length:804 start_codon:yes stop_codon:yes gene_type:complete
MGKNRAGESNLIKVKIKDMVILHHLKDFKGVDIHTNPSFKKTTESIIKEGFKPEKYGHIEVIYQETNNKFKILEGNHRYKILKELYGDEYEVEVEKFKTMTEVIRDYGGRLKEKISPTNIFLLLYNICKQLLHNLYTTPIIPILLLSYVIFWEFLAMMTTMLIIILITIIPKDNLITRKLTTTLKPDNKFHRIIFNILKNMRIISYCLLTIWLTYTFIISNWISFSILILIVYLLKKILEYLTDETYSSLSDVVEAIKKKISNRNKI